jgi:hypothetical protein
MAGSSGYSSDASQSRPQALLTGEAFEGVLIAARQQRRDRCVYVISDVAEVRTVCEIEDCLLRRGDQTLAKVTRHEFRVQEVDVPLDKVDHAVSMAECEVAAVIRYRDDRDAQRARNDVV